MNLDLLEMSLPLVFRTETPISDWEFQQLCESNEILRMERDAEGWIHVMPIPGCRVSLAQIEIGAQLSRWAKKDGRGTPFATSGFALPDGSILGASLSWMLNDRWQSLSGNVQKRFAPCCPDFVIEILSPFDKLTSLRAKMDLWLSNGAQTAWLVDLDRQVVETSNVGHLFDVLRRPNVIPGTGPVAGLEVIMEEVWIEATDWSLHGLVQLDGS